MKYNPFYSDMLVISSVVYFYLAFLDWFITMYAYSYYGDVFFQMEMNPLICDLLKLGIPPMHMFIIPFVLVILSVYFRDKANKLHAESIISDRVIWLVGFAICLIIMMGILHLLGFVSWFYHGAF